MLRHDDLEHLYVQNRVDRKGFARHGGGTQSVRPVCRYPHGNRLLGEAKTVFAAADTVRSQACLDESLRANGVILVLEGWGAGFNLRLNSLTRTARGRHALRVPQWLLLSARPATDEHPETATIWVADKFRSRFLKLFEDYLNKERAKTGKPCNNALVANISRIRDAFLKDLWTSGGDPERDKSTWWELWLDIGRGKPDLLDKVLKAYRLERLDRQTQIGTSRITYVRATWKQLESLLVTDLPLTEIRKPSFMLDTIEDLSDDEKMEYVLDLASRVRPALADAPVVCHLDTGIFREHRLLSGSVASSDLYSLGNFSDGIDRAGHGTSMAGIALYGDHLDALLTGTQQVDLRHRLESVRILDGRKRSTSQPSTPRDNASTTIQAVSLPETVMLRQRVYCMPVSAESYADPGQPTLWSAAIDALAAGTDIVVDDDTVSLISEPDADVSRLIVISAANVGNYVNDYLANSDISCIEDPGQSWNALTVGAYTDMDWSPADPTYRGYRPLAVRGDLSPHSRTSMLFGTSSWPIKPEICMEGGNALTDGKGPIEDSHPLLSLRSTGINSDVALTSANATSAATAQAARLAALVMDRYPSYWPETVRGLLVHEAQWTKAMQDRIDACGRKKRKVVQLLRRYGWGVPTEDSVLHSSSDAVTMIVQDEFNPFDENWTMRELRLHALPWPREVLQDLGANDVCLRITLSYFIEPSATRRGWKGRYTYRSHGLRFDLQGPTENSEAFLARINRQAQNEEDGADLVRPHYSRRWLLGEEARNCGSLHQDQWTGAGAELATCDHVAVYPVGGWWKNNRRQDRRDLPVRYALLISLRTRAQDVDLYTPIATQLEIPVSAVQIEI